MQRLVFQLVAASFCGVSAVFFLHLSLTSAPLVLSLRRRRPEHVYSSIGIKTRVGNSGALWTDHDHTESFDPPALPSLPAVRSASGVAPVYAPENRALKGAMGVWP